MQDVHRQVAFLLATGATQEKITEKTGITADTLSHWRSSTPFNEILSEYRKYFHEENKAYLRLLFGLSLKELKKMLSSESEEVRLQASRLVLETVRHMDIEPEESHGRYQHPKR